MWGLISGVSNAYFGVVDMYNDAVTFLYWDLFDNLCDKLEAIANGLFVRFIALVLLLITVFILSPHFGLFDEESKYQSSRDAHCEQHIKDVTKKRRLKEPRTPIIHAIVPITPVTPAPPAPPRCSEMVLQSLTPSSFKLPFKHFRGTGESFGPLRRIKALQYPRYTRPHLHKDTTSLSIAQKLDKPEEEAPVGRDTKRTVKFEMDVPKKQISASKPPLQPRPVTPPPPPKVEVIQVLPQVHVSKPLQAPPPPPPPPLPDLETVRKDALKRVALEEYRIRQEMVHFLTVITTGVGHESSATIILDMMDQAKQYLEQYFPDGLGHLPFNQIIWRASILTFWDVLSPYGWDFLHHPDQRLPEFLRRFRYFAIWFGLGSRIREFEYVEPPAPEPALAEPVPAPARVEVIPSIPKNLVTGLPLSEPAVLEPPAHQPAVQELPAPEPAVLHTAPAPIEAQPQEPPKLAQISFAPTLPPTTFAFTMGSNSNFSSTTPSTRRKPKPTTSRKQPAKPSPTDPNLLSFTDPSWIHLPTHKINTLTWSSFSWANPLQARLKIWGHSTLTHLSLPRNNPQPVTSSYLKSHLESVAQEFKRAAVILRLQAQGGCEKPCEEDLGMTPLFGEVVMLVEFAADMTAACEEMVVWDEQDEWFRACVYFRDNVREEEAVWKALCEAYGREKYRALERAWEEGSKEWLLLDEEY